MHRRFHHTAPQEHPEAYDETSVMHYADGMRGALLLIHGMIDENVHFRHRWGATW